jgi:hypothetical protein
VRDALRLCGLVLGGCLLAAAAGIGVFAAALVFGADPGYSSSDGVTLLGLAAFVAAGGLAAIAAAALFSSPPSPPRTIFDRTMRPKSR